MKEIKMSAWHPNHPVLSESELLKLASEISYAIEACGASIELTNAVTKSSDFYAHLKRYIESK